MSNATISIGLLWHTYDSGNHGVNALTVSNVAIARAAAQAVGLEPRFTIFAPGSTSGLEVNAEGDRVVRINRRNLLTSRVFAQAVDELACVLDISAGDSFADIYGAKRFFWMWLTKHVAIARGVPLILSPQTIGPFTRQPYKRLAAGLLRDAELTVARDPLSFAAIEALAPGASKLLAADVAFRLPFARRAKANDGNIHVGVNVSGLLWSQSGQGGNHYRLGYDYAQMTTALLDALTARKDVRVHLITHVVDPLIPLDSDGTIAEELATRYPSVVRVPDFADPSEAKSYISGLDFLIGARMHACIAAFSSGVPVVPVAYSRKFVGLFGELLGYPHTLPATGHDEASALRFTLHALDRREELARDVAAGNTRVAPLLDGYDAALRSLFQRVGGVA